MLSVVGMMSVMGNSESFGGTPSAVKLVETLLPNNSTLYPSTSASVTGRTPATFSVVKWDRG